MKNLLFLSFSLLAIAGCKIGDDGVANHKFYSFAQEVSLSNVKKEYAAGDILWLEVNKAGKTFNDVTSGEAVLVKNAKFVFYLDVTNHFSSFTNDDKFNLIKQTGKVLSEGEFSEKGLATLSFGCPDQSYTFKMGVQFLKPGGYIVWLNNVQNPPQIFFTDTENCAVQDQFPPPAEASFASITMTFNVADTNRDKLDEYAAANPGTSADLNALRKAVDEKMAFFAWVK
jgi:hypothetical protein